ncbi:peptidase family M48-domain-containing protein [Exophiala viscosa]|uniref:Peptidase family M48-domain-containing protein n=1 Tax=Exophiala viscosa TaxID=2486360 RepID=A0AAN6DRM6_9EURO|nr:peptidase family M48-domain-containing protein [Exophiala viscosa]
MIAFRVGLRTASRATFRTTSNTTRSRPFSNTPLEQARRYRPFDSPPQYPRITAEAADGGAQQQKWSRIAPVYRAQYIWRNYRGVVMTFGAGGVVFYVYNLEKVPVTNRRRFNIFSPEAEKEVAGSSNEYKQQLEEYRGKILPPNHQKVKIVTRVVNRLLPTTGGLAGDDWEINVIDAPEIQNAFVMPGGKVFVFTGILAICQNEDGVATVLGHEIAHNVAHHVAERISGQIWAYAFAFGVSLFFDWSGGLSNQIAQLLLSLPNSRTQEEEADHIGLLMMAEACYDPRQAVAFWERMAKAEKVTQLEFLSTHPSTYNRIDHIKQWLPQALDRYNEKDCSITSQYAKDFTGALGRQIQEAPDEFAAEFNSVTSSLMQTIRPFYTNLAVTTARFMNILPSPADATSGRKAG